MKKRRQRSEVEARKLMPEKFHPWIKMFRKKQSYYNLKLELRLHLGKGLREVKEIYRSGKA